MSLPAPPSPRPAAPNAEETLDDEELANLLDQLDQQKDDKGSKVGDGSNNQEAEKSLMKEMECERNGSATGYLAYSGLQPIEGAEEFMGWSEKDCAQFCTANLVINWPIFPVISF